MTNTGRVKCILLEFCTCRYIGVDMWICEYIYMGVSFLFLSMIERRKKRKKSEEE